MEDDTEDWISAAEALALLTPEMGESRARRTICSRANDGIIQTRAAQFVVAKHNPESDFVLPRSFWWARGEVALQQNWVAGDFEGNSHEERSRVQLCGPMHYTWPHLTRDGPLRELSGPSGRS